MSDSEISQKTDDSNDETELSSDDALRLPDEDAALEKAFNDKKFNVNVLNRVAPIVQWKHIVNNTNGLKSVLDDIKLNLPWIERLDLDCDLAPIAPELSAEFANDEDISQNDFKREVSFYRQAQTATIHGIQRLKELGVPTKRPDDYFAEMLKTDEHMQKIRSDLVFRQSVMEKREQARKLRELRKYGKQVQLGIHQQRLKDKKEMTNMMKKARQGNKEKLNYLNCEDEGQNRSSDAKRQKLRRDARNRKYGGSGKKRGLKRNTAKSCLDFKSDLPTRGKIGKRQK